MLLSLYDDELAAWQDRISGDYPLNGHAADNAKSERHVADIESWPASEPADAFCPSLNVRGCCSLDNA
jgi:hypothetical protein